MPKLGTCGAYQFVPASQSWTWSEEAYLIYGFGAGDVLPSTDLLLRHQHPEDRDAFAAFLEDVLGAGGGSLWHRIVDAQGAVHRVLTTAVVEVDAATGRPRGVRGHVVDLTEAVRVATAQEVDQALALLAESRPVIEQAKGVVMSAYGLDADEAFGVLRGCSQLSNVKVRDVARAVVDGAVSGGGPGPEARRLLDRLAAQARRQRLEAGA